MQDITDIGRKQPKPTIKRRRLDVVIEGDEGDGKSRLTWLLVNALETFGADANVIITSDDPDIGESAEFVRHMHDRDHGMRPGDMHGLTVNITTKRILREPDED